MREDIFTPEHRTRILPLRILANYIFHPISMFFFRIGLKYYRLDWIGYRLYFLFDYPYKWWGTVYVWNGVNLSGEAWNDYDKNGHPYWYYTEWQEDPETGDAWRLVKRENNDIS